jgi:hypothetical protein
MRNRINSTNSEKICAKEDFDDPNWMQSYILNNFQCKLVSKRNRNKKTNPSSITTTVHFLLMSWNIIGSIWQSMFTLVACSS